MGKALYRKYRSKSLGEVIGQEHITLTLSNALKNNQISHAYLLTGPRGVGKTSVARILAHEINKLPYEDEKQHLDIIEIDAASNRRIDEIRDLREKSKLAPTSAPYKVYIIDEVHMLTKEAFNALLKTLEEPPAHVVFILATTELHKLPATIISRTQRFAFRPINNVDMIKHLKNISTKENIVIDDKAIELIAHHAGGGFRDAISLLDQIRSTSENINLDDVERVLGRPGRQMVEQLLEATISGQINNIYESLEELYGAGYSPSIIAESLLQEGQSLLRVSSSSGVLALLDELLKIELSVNKTIALEVCLIKIAREVANVDTITPITKKTKAPQIIENEDIKDIKPIKNKIPETIEETNNQLSDFKEIWNKVLANIKSKHNTLHGILNSATAEYIDKDKAVALSFRFPFHLKKASEARNQNIIKKALSDITNEEYGLLFKKQDKQSSSKKTVNATKPNNDSVISSVINVFGGGEVIK